jgi:hypothetical protein
LYVVCPGVRDSPNFFEASWAQGGGTASLNRQRLHSFIIRLSLSSTTKNNKYTSFQIYYCLLALAAIQLCSHAWHRQNTVSLLLTCYHGGHVRVYATCPGIGAHITRIERNQNKSQWMFYYLRRFSEEQEGPQREVPLHGSRVGRHRPRHRRPCQEGTHNRTTAHTRVVD